MPDLCRHTPFSCRQVGLNDHYLFISYAIRHDSRATKRKGIDFSDVDTHKHARTAEKDFSCGTLSVSPYTCNYLTLFWLSSYLNYLRSQLVWIWISDVLLYLVSKDPATCTCSWICDFLFQDLFAFSISNVCSRTIVIWAIPVIMTT